MNIPAARICIERSRYCALYYTAIGLFHQIIGFLDAALHNASTARSYNVFHTPRAREREPRKIRATFIRRAEESNRAHDNRMVYYSASREEPMRERKRTYIYILQDKMKATAKSLIVSKQSFRAFMRKLNFAN